MRIKCYRMREGRREGGRDFVDFRFLSGQMINGLTSSQDLGRSLCMSHWYTVQQALSTSVANFQLVNTAKAPQSKPSSVTIHQHTDSRVA